MNIQISGAVEVHNYGDLLMGLLCYNQVANSGNKVILKNGCPEMYELVEYKVEDINTKPDICICFGGGYVFLEGNLKRKLSKLKKHFYPMIMSRIRHVPYIVIGVGTGKIEKGLSSRIINWCCSGAEIIAVRNEESLIDLRTIGVKNDIQVTADMVLTLDPTMIPVSYMYEAKKLVESINSYKKMFIHISSHYIEDEKKASAIVFLIEALSEFAKKNPDYGFVIGFDNDSINARKVCSDIYDVLPQERTMVMSKSNVYYLTAILNEMDYIITTKLHVGIVGAVFNKSVTAFYSKDKVKRFYSQINNTERAVLLHSIDSKETALKIIMDHTGTIMNNFDEVRKKSQVNNQCIEQFVKKYS